MKKVKYYITYQGGDAVSFQKNFKRRELKYLITNEQRERIKEAMRDFTVPDEYGRSTIRNVYYDTPDMLLIRRSIEKPVYKEKLRARTYGEPGSDAPVFVEIKKKCLDVVYKRRAYMTLDEQEEYLARRIEAPFKNHITKEIDYFIRLYGTLRPAVYISYDREAYYAKDDHEFRITFDDNILWRDTDLSLRYGVYGEPIIEDGMSLMEIKVANSMPLWMVAILTKERIYKTSFSKYGRAYTSMLTGGKTCFKISK